MVFQWGACADLPHRTFEDRTVVYQRLAILRPLQQPSRHWRADFVQAEWLAIDSRQSIHAWRRRLEHSRSRALSHRRQHPDQVLRQPGEGPGQTGVLAYRRYRLRTPWRRELLHQFRKWTEAGFSRFHVLQPGLV